MLRVLYHIGKDTKYIANKQECNRFFAPSRVEEDTAEERRNKETEMHIIIRCGQIERTHRNIDITHNIHRQYNNIIY